TGPRDRPDARRPRPADARARWLVDRAAGTSASGFQMPPRSHLASWRPALRTACVQTSSEFSPSVIIPEHVEIFAVAAVRFVEGTRCLDAPPQPRTADHSRAPVPAPRPTQQQRRCAFLAAARPLDANTTTAARVGS